MEEEKDPVDALIELGSDIVGQGIGAALGYFSKGPADAAMGAIAGTIFTNCFKEMSKDFRKRHLSKREEMKIGAALAFATIKIELNLKKGKLPRKDNFFNGSNSERASAEEILEGTLLVAQREYEEKN